MDMFGKKCLKCDSKNVKTQKESFLADFKRSLFNVMLPIRFFTGHGKKPKPLNVCRDCGFSWEDR